MRNYHVYGIGNALLDREAKVDEAFLQTLNIQKGVMTLIDDDKYEQLTRALAGKFCHHGCGGSAANTLIALSQFGGQGFYSCKIANDNQGQLFLNQLMTFGIDSNLSKDNLASGITGQCLVLVTEDSQRTMNTHLGISETLDPSVLNFKAISAAEYLYLEGYLVTSPTAKAALIEARQYAKKTSTKVALTLSDPTIVRYFKNDLLAVMDGQVDLLFCNQEEALLFTQAHYLEEAINLLQTMTHHLIVTLGSNGAILAIDGEMLLVPTFPIKAIDTVGAGDMFAGAYLYGITHGYAPQLAIVLANRAAAEVVGQYGARLTLENVLDIKKDFIENYYVMPEQTKLTSSVLDLEVQ